jgi:8-oxo-dGTP diphosphatase
VDQLSNRNRSQYLAGATIPEPSVDVRVVLFTLTSGELLVAIRRDGPELSVPRAMPDVGESLDAAARRIVRSSTSIQEQYLEQLYTLSVIEDDKRWSIIVSYIALICSDSQPVASPLINWSTIERLGRLSTADTMVIDYGVVRLRAKLGYTNIAFHLLPARFTLTELQTAYETILGQALDKRNFRSRMIASGILIQTDEKRRDGSHRPAALYRFRAEQDTASYLTPPWSDPANGATDS